jgi:hypothetical protein
VISGHNHTSERLLIKVLPYIGNGLGGAVIYAFGIPLDGSNVRYNDDHGAMLVESPLKWIRFQFMTRNGIVVDDYPIEH